MKTVNRILVAVDFSDFSLTSVQYAADLARDVGAELVLTNVINERDVAMMRKVAVEAPAFSVETYLRERKNERLERFQDLISKASCSDLHVTTSVRVGIPHEELLKEIDEKKADLLVMATKGRSNLVDTLVGSCAQKMFRRSPVPLLSIRV